MGIFASQSNLFRRYRARVQFRDKVMGGTPKDPKLIEGWLRAKAGITDVDEIRMALIRTLAEQGADVRPDMTYEEVEQAAEKIAGTKETTGFKRGEHGLYIEARQIKAAIKEAASILYEWQGSPQAQAKKYGISKKAISYVAERVFVAPDQIWLGRAEPDGVDMVVGHVSGPQGPRSTLGYHEYVQRATINFDVLVTRDAVPHEWWPELWEQMQENAIGALRSQGYGKFDILAWDTVDATSSVPEPGRDQISAGTLGVLYAEALTA